MNYQKFKTVGIQGIFRHVERYKNNEGEYIKFSNQNIDARRTNLNYNLAPEHNQYEFLKKRLSQLTYREQKNNTVCCGWCVTAPKNMTDPKDLKKFFKVVYNELNKIYNEKNVISAYIHMDEATPHLHYLFVPGTQDKKLSASKMTDRKLLQHIHDDIQKVIDREFGSHKFLIVADNPSERQSVKGSPKIKDLKQALVELETQKEIKQIDNEYLDYDINRKTKKSKELQEQNEHQQQTNNELQEQLNKNIDSYNEWIRTTITKIKAVNAKLDEYQDKIDNAIEAYELKQALYDMVRELPAEPPTIVMDDDLER